MAAPRFKVIYLDGRVVSARVGPRAQVAYERHFKTSVAKFAENPGAEQLYFLAWVALHYSGQEPADFDAFLDLLEDVDADGEEPVNPTEPGQ